MLATILLLPFIGALAIYFWPGGNARVYKNIGLAASGLALALLLPLTLAFDANAPVSFTLSWMPDIGLDFSIWLDGVSLFWAWLVLGIGFLVVWYAGHYMAPDDGPRRFYGALMLFMGAMLGVVLSRNLLMMFVFWEMTSVTSFLLIGHWRHKKEAGAGAKRALLLTGMGGLALMAGIALVAIILKDAGLAASLTWDAVTDARAEILGHSLAVPALVLMLMGAFTKSAQFPFHFWLPGAMEAPTPVSAYLHAATMVKAGIYLMGRLYPIFGDLDIWLLLLGGAGVITMLMGGWLALFCHDIKQLLAYSTVSQLGLITAYYGFGFRGVGEEGAVLTLDLMLVASHAFFKAGLFMLCGVVDHGAHTRDWRKLGGLFRKMPYTGALTIAGCLSMAGAPLTLGFVAKKLFLEAGVRQGAVSGTLGVVLMWAAIFATVFTMAYCLRLVILVFFGKPRDPEVVSHAHEGGPGILFGPAVLVGLSVLGGLYVPAVAAPIASWTNPLFYGLDPYYTFAFFTKLDFLFWVSMIVYFVAGPLFFWLPERLGAVDALQKRVAAFITFFDKSMNEWIPAFAGWQRGIIHSHSLGRNSFVVYGFAFGVVAWFLPFGDLRAAAFEWQGAGTLVGALLLVGGAASLAVLLFSRKTIFRVLALGAIGLGVAVVFLLYKAPDLVMTQLLVELVVLVLVLLMLRTIGLSDHKPLRGALRFGAPAAAALAGVVVASLTFLAASSPDQAMPGPAKDQTIASFYLQNSGYPAEAGGHGGQGSNVVNVVLVDFRALDTLGEVVVVAIAALGVASLLRWRRHPTREQILATLPDPAKVASIGDFQLPRQSPLVLRCLAPVVAALALLFSFVLFYVGHNAPGGGFIGGLLTAVALLPFGLASDRVQYDSRFFRHTYSIIPVGIVFAVGTGLAAVALGAEFLRSGYAKIPVPLLGEWGLSSALAFDVGVYLVVVGSVLTILKAFSRS